MKSWSTDARLRHSRSKPHLDFLPLSEEMVGQKQSHVIFELAYYLEGKISCAVGTKAIAGFFCISLLYGGKKFACSRNPVVPMVRQ